ncbi:MAG: glycerophosphodiester phosphodiesterase [Candidatus Riflebacteria bacterium]|nr:glycerophosphodiester phosphodiesterase [Candidatus Riflebacteria bacterium]
MSRCYLTFVITVVVLTIATSFHEVSAESSVQAQTMGKTPKKIEVYAHRGARSFAPENSLPGYSAGLRIGTDWVDMDVVLDRDGEVVVTHDIWLNPDIVRGPDGAFLAANKNALIKGVSDANLNSFLQPFLVKNMTIKELGRYDVGRLNPESSYAAYFPDQIQVDGTRIPSLREVIRWVKSNASGIGFQIEIKTDPEHPDWTFSPTEIAAALYKILKEEGLTQRCEIQAFDWRCLYAIQKLDPLVKTAYLTEWDNEIATGPVSFFDPDPKNAGLWTGGKLVKEFGNSIPRMVKELGGTCWEPEDAELTREALDEAHKLGLKVVVWTWPEHLGTAFDSKLTGKLIDWGVDGIITDDPGRLISMLAARGYPLPKRYNIE